MAKEQEAAAASRRPQPRLCAMQKGDNGYGFHLHGEKGKSGQFIRKVEPDSPAEAAGLRAGDRVVEVNGVNVEKETHHQVVQRIKAVEAETRLLVVDKETDEYLRNLRLTCTEEMVHPGTLANPDTSPVKMPTSDNGDVWKPQAELSCRNLKRHKHSLSSESGKKVNGMNVEGMKHSEVVSHIKSKESEAKLLVVDPETDERFKKLGIVPTEEHVRSGIPQSMSNGSAQTQLNGGSMSSSHSDCQSPEKESEVGEPGKKDPFEESGLDLSPTAAEAKEKVRAKRVNKRAPQMDWNKKREIFSNF
ncbi:Na(+)/H(+) exchange regulatory cofactor NHE-RF2 isoform X2 [Eublepharis macularius]|uniref:Na(+)/H(+) exchange regulatory cofactor NHE-RF2 isoform X2 n=1 Tax=Eublepharis macularius TaxID=481883 RepID=A0AA97K805_EUBMA|nr:Na(+)/H(+) exchange regulatory cofactor NHE-RF2 isoform X2 [Eublepharis macularius]